MSASLTRRPKTAPLDESIRLAPTDERHSIRSLSEQVIEDLQAGRQPAGSQPLSQSAQ